MKRSFRWKTWLRVGGTLALVGFLAARLNWTELAQAITHLSPMAFWGSVGVFLMAQFVSTVRWRQLALDAQLHAGLDRFGVWYAAGMFCNLVLPTSVGGDVVRTWYLAQQADGPLDGRTRRAATSVLLDRGTGLMVLIALAGVASILCPVALTPQVTWFLYAVLACTALGLAIGLTSSGFIGRKVPKLAPLISQAWDFARKPGLVASSLALSVLVQVASVVQVGLIGKGLGLDVPWAVYGCVVPLVTLLTLLPLSVSGMGLREAGYAALLAGFGVTAPQAVALSLLGFAATSLVALLGLPVIIWGGWPRVGTDSGTHSAQAANESAEHLKTEKIEGISA
ncbi:MAG: UPF0104 family protein [Planctomycetota bacterium]|nr:MAG: UPF0104 family protein [Planctomycetota bacterium]